jgi:flagellar FliJ protein
MSTRFPLQRLLHLRQQHEHAMARDLASARESADTELRTHDGLRESQERAQQDVALKTAENPTIGTILSLTHAIDHFDAHVELASERVRAADAVVAQRHVALTVAAQARQILDRLRDKHETAAMAKERARDLQRMDEAALTRFMQPDDDPSTRSRTTR